MPVMAQKEHYGHYLNGHQTNVLTHKKKKLMIIVVKGLNENLVSMAIQTDRSGI